MVEADAQSRDQEDHESRELLRGGKRAHQDCSDGKHVGLWGKRDFRGGVGRKR